LSCRKIVDNFPIFFRQKIFILSYISLVFSKKGKQLCSVCHLSDLRWNWVYNSGLSIEPRI